MMRKWTGVILCISMLFLLVACGNTSQESRNNTARVEPQETMDNTADDVSSAESLPTEKTDAAAKTEKDNGVAVVYFSATGTTKEIARKIAGVLEAEIFEIIPKEAYSSDDLDYNEDSCRANKEMNDESSRPDIENDLSAVKEFDRIYIGYPIWWGKEPMVIRTFLESYNLKGKKIVPFCTSGGSGISGSMKGVKAAAKGAKVVKGKDLTDSSAKSVQKWAEKKVA
ncbi:flavodoxin [bacterium D16-51]|nr:flavodoxin [bacterium D16-59]RKI57039.1 flavodoxin [bacterium D16-51]